jgi:hypothetical protein
MNPLAEFSKWFTQLSEDVQLHTASLLLLSMPDTGVRSKHFIECSPQDLLNDWLNNHVELEPLKVIGATLAVRACVDFILMSKRDTEQRWQALAQFTDG